MGQRTAINQMSKQKKQVKKTVERSLRLNFDVPLLLVTITLLVFGLIIVYSASYSISFYVSKTDSPNEMFFRQLLWLGIGLVFMTSFALIDYRKWQKFVVIGMLGTIIALVGVLIFGDTTEDTTRNLIGGSAQPSELAKLMIVIYLSVWLYAKREILSNINFGLLPLAAILGVVGGLIFGQPDLSAAATVVMLGCIMFFVAGGDWKQISLLMIVTLVIGLIVIQVNPIGKERVGSFILGLKDPMESSDHVVRALDAFANGGWFGVGIGQGTIKLTILPVPHTDSIFAVVGEELGVVGASLLICLFGVFIWRGLYIARRAPDGLGSLLAAGISIWIGMEAFMNMLALTGLFPFAGNPLPFFSIGGSSLVFTLFGVGILLNVSRQSEQKQLEDERRIFGALIDLRGRDWRGRVSRTRRTRSTHR
jgi:cell division protein FtsW